MIVNILNNKSVWKFLAIVSYSPGAGFSRKNILNMLKWNNLSLDRTLRKLYFYDIIKKDKRTIKLKFSNFETDKLLKIIEEDKKKMNYPQFEIFIVLNEFLRLVEGIDIDAIYLFGSHAKKTASSNSDIDIAIFSDKNLNLIETKDKILQEYGKEIQLHYFKNDEKSKLVSEVFKHGVKML